jgi:hypothetical protein
VDWSTIVVSAVISAALGVLVAFVTASLITVRQARARRREDARQELAQIAAEMRLTLSQYRALQDRARPHDDERARLPKQPNTADQLAAGRVLQAASGLGWFRRWLVKRRCRRIFGRFWTDRAELFLAADSEVSVGPAVFAGLNHHPFRSGNAAAAVSQRLHRAYAAPPRDPLQAELDRELRRLGACVVKRPCLIGRRHP